MRMSDSNGAIKGWTGANEQNLPNQLKPARWGLRCLFLMDYLANLTRDSAFAMGGHVDAKNLHKDERL